MTTYHIGTDNIVGKSKDYEVVSKMIKVFEKAGHTCKHLGVGPNVVQSNGLQASSKGVVGVYVVGGSDIGTYVDFRDQMKRGGYHYKFVWFAFASWTATTDKWITENGLKNTPLVRAHDDNFSSQSSIAPYLGKSADNFFSQNKTILNYVYGQTPEELANKILSGGGDSSSKNKSGNSASSVKECIQKLLTHWDGEAECRIVNEKVYINKIKDPQSDYELVLQEGVNIYSDSLQITDVNPNTVNHLIVTWTKGKITFKDEDLIKRFGEHKKEVQAVKKVVKTETVTTTTSTDTATDTETTDTGTDTTTDTETTDTTTDTAAEETTTTETKTTVTEVPIDNYKDAQAFANIEWNKIKRDNGHTLECQVQGSSKWRPGKWAKVIIPSFNENGFMYITRASHSDDGGDWHCNLSLADYPPGWGEEQIETTTEDSEEESSEVTETDTAEEGE